MLNAGAKYRLDAMLKSGDCCVGLFLLAVWFLGLFLLESCPASAQIAVSPAPITDCQDVALEATPHIYRAPGDVQVIAIAYRNTTAHAWSFRQHFNGTQKRGANPAVDPPTPVKNVSKSSKQGG